MFARVIVDIVHSNVDRLFEYSVPVGMKLDAGYRVKVPFGKGNALLEGYVLGLSEQCEYKGVIKPISSVISDFPALTAGQIKLAEMMQRYYHTTLSACLRLMFPAEMRGGGVKDKFERELIFSLSGEEYEKATASFSSGTGRVKAPKQLEVLRLMRERRRLNIKELEAILPGSASARDALVKKGFLVSEQIKAFRNPAKAHEIEREFELSPEQLNAYDRISSEKGKYLLHGVTGSGKTEVYIKLVKDCLKRGESAIVLVPEISLTPQLVAMFERRIGEHIAVYHSTLSAGERYDEWKRMVLGESRVVIGARSAVFAPLRNIGIIIIDEEHETSYRSDTHPKFTAHEIARMRANIEGSSLLLASATPSVESYIKARNGIYSLVEMPSRLFGLKLPEMITVDMREEIVKGNRTVLSGRLYGEMKTALAAGKQIMLFLNRRGYSTFVMCRGCGYVEYCDRCEVSMTYHSTLGALVCHYCGRRRSLRDTCPSCGRKYLKQFGIGTQQVEDQVKKLFPDARVLRMDLDTTRSKDSHLKIYELFKERRADILIGTQMIAKGLDFENVSLVGVISADSSLHIPDYRSPEKTFALLEQVAGRAGRKNPGKVIVQTYCPDHYAVEYANTHNYKGFFDEEMAVRRKALLPPYSFFFRVVFAGKYEDAAKNACIEYAKGLKDAYADIMEHVLLFDISEAPVKKIQGKTRWQVLIKVLNDDKLSEFRKRLYEYSDGKVYKDCAFGMEINPQSMI